MNWTLVEVECDRVSTRYAVETRDRGQAVRRAMVEHSRRYAKEYEVLSAIRCWMVGKPAPTDRVLEVVHANQTREVAE